MGQQRHSRKYLKIILDGASAFLVAGGISMRFGPTTFYLTVVPPRPRVFDLRWSYSHTKVFMTIFIRTYWSDKNVSIFKTSILNYKLLTFWSYKGIFYKTVFVNPILLYLTTHIGTTKSLFKKCFYRSSNIILSLLYWMYKVLNYKNAVKFQYSYLERGNKKTYYKIETLLPRNLLLYVFSFLR